MNLPKLVIFDMDGLIFDSETLFSGELKKVMARYGYALTKENYLHTVGINKNGARILMKEMYGDDYPFDEISAIAREQVNEIADAGGLVIKPGIVELLQFWDTKKIPCCVASSSPSTYVCRYLELSGIRQYFCGILGGENVSHSKPDPEIFLTSCKNHNTAPEQALVLEDSESGILAALHAHIPVICIPDLKVPSDKLLTQTLYTASDAHDVIRFYNH
jgi:HAD superfamily hydrolase (TIGR01509 family)